MAYAVVGRTGSCRNEPESDVRPFSAWHEFSGCVAWTRIAISRSLVEYHRRQDHSRTGPCNVSSESKLVKIDQAESNYSGISSAVLPRQDTNHKEPGRVGCS